ESHQCSALTHSLMRFRRLVVIPFSSIWPPRLSLVAKSSWPNVLVKRFQRGGPLVPRGWLPQTQPPPLRVLYFLSPDRRGQLWRCLSRSSPEFLVETYGVKEL